MYAAIAVLGFFIIARIVWRRLGEAGPRARVAQFVTGAGAGVALALLADETVASPHPLRWIGGSALLCGALSAWFGRRFWRRLAGAAADTPP